MDEDRIRDSVIRVISEIFSTDSSGADGSRSGVQREKSCLGHNKSSKEKELLDRYMSSPVTSLT